MIQEPGFFQRLFIIEAILKIGDHDVPQFVQGRDDQVLDRMFEQGLSDQIPVFLHFFFRCGIIHGYCCLRELTGRQVLVTEGEPGPARQFTTIRRIGKFSVVFLPAPLPAPKKSAKSINFINLPALKRVAAILLMGVLCFNWFGYRLLTAYMQTRSDKQLEARLDDNRYDESQLISIKIPSHLVYSNPSMQFERVDGQVEVGGILYKYVKRRIYNDSLELLCIPNHAAMGLRTAKNEFFQLVNDIQHNGQDNKTNSHPGTSKSPVSPEYLGIDRLFAINSLQAIDLPFVFTDHSSALSSNKPQPAERPPDQFRLQA